MSSPVSLPLSSAQIAQIQTLAKGLIHGSITLIFQDGKLIQIDKNQKIRLSKSKN